MKAWPDGQVRLCKKAFHVRKISRWARGGDGGVGGVGGPAGGYNLFWIVDVGRKTAATSCSCED